MEAAVRRPSTLRPRPFLLSAASTSGETPLSLCLDLSCNSPLPPPPPPSTSPERSAAPSPLLSWRARQWERRVCLRHSPSHSIIHPSMFIQLSALSSILPPSLASFLLPRPRPDLPSIPGRLSASLSSFLRLFITFRLRLIGCDAAILHLRNASVSGV